MPTAPKKPVADVSRVILVTGAGGFVGSELCRRLRTAFPGSQRILMFRSQPNSKKWSSAESLVRGDLDRQAVWKNLPDTVTHVVHLAAVKPGSGRDTGMLRKNLESVRQLCRRAKRWPQLRQIIFISSVSVYPWTGRPMSEKSPLDPAGAYGRAKMLAEDEIRRIRPFVRTCILRMSSVYGSGQDANTVIPRMIEQAKKRHSVEVFGSGDRVMDFVHVRDAADAICAALKHESHGVYNVGSGRSVNMKRLAAEVLKCFAGRGRGILLRRKEMDGGGPGLRLSTARASRDWKWRAMPLSEGLKLMKHPKVSA